MAFADFFLGDWLQGSEWTYLFSSASIRTTRSADAILSASHVKKARYVHQVTAPVLHSPLMETYDANEQLYDVWLVDRRKKSSNFKYWFTCLEIECLMLLFVESVRSGDCGKCSLVSWTSLHHSCFPWSCKLCSIATCFYSVTGNVTSTTP